MKRFWRSKFLLVIFVGLQSNGLMAQNKKSDTIDSLKRILAVEVSLKERVNTLEFISQAYANVGLVEERKEAYKSIIDLTRNNDQYRDEYAGGLIRLGNLYQRTRELKKADSLAILMLRIKDRNFSDSSRNEMAINALYLRGVTNTLMGLPDTAIYYLQKTEVLAAKLDRKRRKASAQGALAVNYVQQGDYSKAIEAYKRVISELEPDNHQSIQNNHYNLAALYLEIDEHHKAIETIAKAKESALEESKMSTYTYSVILEITAYREMNKLSLAKSKLEVLKMVILEKNYQPKPDVLHGIYNVEILLAYDRQDTSTFVKKTEEFLKIVPEDQAEQILQVDIRLFNYYNNLVNYHTMFGRWDKAIQLLQDYEKVGFLRDRRERLYRRFAEIFEATGDYKNALVYHKQYMLAKDSLFNEEKALDIGRAESQLQLSKQENDILLAEAQITRQENDILQAQAEISNQRFIIMVSIVGIAALVIIIVISYRAYRSKKAANLTLDRKNEELSLALDDLERAQGQLIASEKLASMGRLYAGLAHEINNPLVFVKSGVDTLERELAKPSAEHEEKGGFDWVLDIIKDGIKRVQVIVSSISHYSSETNAAASSENVNETIDSILTLMQSEIKDTITINKHYQDVPPIVFGKGQLGQVFMNILINAIHAIDSKGEIDITTEYVDNVLVVSFKDTGSGMDEAVKERVFEPFFTTKQPGEGLGLGLHITRSAVEANNGEIFVESEGLGKGSTITIKFQMSA